MASKQRRPIGSADYLVTGLILCGIGGALVGSDIAVGWIFLVGGGFPATAGTIGLGVRLGIEDAKQRADG